MNATGLPFSIFGADSKRQCMRTASGTLVGALEAERGQMGYVQVGSCYVGEGCPPGY
jgi:hypothetical protein